MTTQSISVGSKYQYTLSSGRTVTVIIHGSSADPIHGTVWDITVNDIRGTYADVNQAIGESYIARKQLP
jgi:hypothetical protein